MTPLPCGSRRRGRRTPCESGAASPRRSICSPAERCARIPSPRTKWWPSRPIHRAPETSRRKCDDGGMSTAISVSKLRKAFGRTVALDGLDLEVTTGEVHGFLGPNGAGKSTTIRVLLGLLRPDDGQVRLLDGDPWRDAASLHRRL